MVFVKLKTNYFGNFFRIEHLVWKQCYRVQVLLDVGVGNVTIWHISDSVTLDQIVIEDLVQK